MARKVDPPTLIVLLGCLLELAILATVAILCFAFLRWLIAWVFG